ncbi:MAG: histidine phosphatase family protein [Saprospiraceae bacterium]|nr:histidine phosphatase family protein [Saprospiraceae bacterium]
MRLFIGLIVLLALSCKQPEVVIDGKYIQDIERNKITLEGGHVLDLNNEKGSKIIYLVRHAEKDTIPEKNPILTDEGYERSYRLAELLKKTRIDAIYSTLYNRTMHTVDSLATLKGLKTNIYQPKDLRQMGIDITDQKDLNSIIISGHSNTTPAMANVFMGQKMIDAGFHESDYDNFLVVNIMPDGKKKLYQLRYK